MKILKEPTFILNLTQKNNFILKFIGIIFISIFFKPAFAILGGLPVSSEMKIARSTVGISTVQKKYFPTLELALENIKKYPYTYCTGTLIDDHIIITAAHCLRYQWDDVFTFAVFGSDFSPSLKFDARPVLLDRRVVHENFQTKTLEDWNDVALLHMTKPPPQRVTLIPCLIYSYWSGN